MRAKGYLVALALALAALLASGCAKEQEEAIDLVGTKWALVSMEGKRLIKDTEIGLYFEEDRFGGKMTCNQYGGGRDSGRYLITGDGDLTIVAPLAVTMQLCSQPQGIMEQEQAYITVLLRTASYRIDQDRLELRDDAGETILVYDRARE